jgi:DNA-binding MarR family transcriptional regulator/predicted GNAT family acetyltransferase
MLSSAFPPVADDQVQAVRAFNRFYTRKLGVLDQQLMKSPFSLSEARVLYEIAQGGEQSAKEIGLLLGLDPGYLSRIVQNFEDSGLILRKPLPADRRQYQLTLTAKGRQAFGRLERMSQDDVGAMLQPMRSEDRRTLTEAMATIERLLSLAGAPAPLATLRAPRPGDMGWIVQSHGALYAREYGFNADFEALVADIVASFFKAHDPARERCWIADIDGRPVGSVFVVDAGAHVAKLRLLLLDPSARGQGLGQRLVSECITFARACGYRRMTLWTQSILFAARKIYQDAGFHLVSTEPHRGFGEPLVGETWERDL